MAIVGCLVSWGAALPARRLFGIPKRLDTLPNAVVAARQHEGWLTGMMALASDTRPSEGEQMQHLQSLIIKFAFAIRFRLSY